MKKPTVQRGEAIAENVINGNGRDAAASFDGFSGKGAAAQALMVAIGFCPELERTPVRDLLSQLLIRLPFTHFDK